MLKPGVTSGEGDEALECYAKHTAQIEVTAQTDQIVELKTKMIRLVGEKESKCGLS